jgi:hypothetical protein
MSATTYPVNQQSIIQSALRQVIAGDTTSQPGTYDYTNVSQALNMLVKNWVADGIPLWQVSTITLPMVANKATYTMGPTAADLVVPRPLRVLEAEIQNTISLQTIQLWSLSREQYVQLSGKAISFGIPTQYWFEPLGGEQTSPNARVTMYPVPFTGITQQVLFKVLQPIVNFSALTDVIDFPDEYLLPLKWCLAYEIANEYPVSDSRYARIEKRALQAKETIIEWGQEQDVEVVFKYDLRGR